MTSTDRYRRRDELLGMFWPESNERRARSSLSEALSRLRRALGSAVVVTRGDNEVGVASKSLRCDAVGFASAIEANDLLGAAELYRGPLLEGFVLDGGTDFNEWLERTRARFARQAVEAIGTLSDVAPARGLQPQSPHLAD